MNEQTITFDTGTTLTMDEYNDYIEQQLAWIDGLPKAAAVGKDSFLFV